MPRNVKSGDHMHTVFRVSNREFLFSDAHDHTILLRTLERQKRRYGARLFAWTGMSNHHHVFNESPSRWHSESAFARRQQSLGIPVTVGDMLRDSFSYYARAFNAHRQREGALIKDRTKTIAVRNQRHAIAILVYLFLNPVRAQIVRDPADYPYCNFRQYAFGETIHDDLFDLHPAYIAMGSTPALRQNNFRALVASAQETWASQRWGGASGTGGKGRNKAIQAMKEYTEITDEWCLRHSVLMDLV